MPSRSPLRSINSLLLMALVAATAAPLPAWAARPKQFQAGGLTLSNEHLSLTLYGEATFSLATADGRHLLFPGATSYISLRADGSTYSARQENLPPLAGPTAADATTALESFSTDEGVRFRVTYTLVGEALRLTVQAENASGASRSAAARFLLDTQVDVNDGSPLWANGRVYTQETELRPPFTTFKGYDQIPNPSFTSTGTFLTPPTRVVFAHWPRAHGQPWDYTPDESLPFYTPGVLTTPLSDSAVLVYYDLGTLAPGAAAEATLSYGLAAPQAAGLDALLLELERTEAAIHSRLDADVERLAEVQARAYQVLLTSHDPEQWIASLVDSTAWGTALYSLLSLGDPSRILFRLGTQLMRDVLENLDEQTLNQLRSMMPALYQDLGLAPDSPELQSRIRELIARNLAIQERHEQVASAFQALAGELRATGLPSDYPLNPVIDAMRTYRSQLEATAAHEGLLIWPDPDVGSAAFQVSGLLEKHQSMAERLRPVEGVGHGFRTFGFWLAAGATAKTVIALASRGMSVPLELVIMTTGSSIGFLTGTAGREIEIINDRGHAFLALHSSLAAARELDLVQASASDVVRAVREAGQVPSAWNAQVEVFDVRIDNVQVAPGEALGTAQGQVTVHNLGQAPVPVAVFATLLAPTGSFLSPVGVLGQPSPVRVAPGEQAAISFDFGAPDSRLWGTASPYSVDLWLGAGYRAIHVNTDPRFAARLNLTATTGQGAEALARRQVSLVDSGQLSENQSSRNQFAIRSDSSVTSLELSYGSDFDLHLYDAQGRHVGLNYDTGEIDSQIPGVTYSGPSARPEWLRIEGHAGERFETEVVAVQVEEPQTYTLVGSQIPALPALLGIDPVTLFVLPQDLPGEVRGQAGLYEFGGQQGVSAIEATATNLRGQSGEEIPPSAIHLAFPQEVGPGELALGEVTLTIGQRLPEGDYSGHIELKGTDASSGEPVSATAQLTLRVLSMGEATSAPPAGGGGLGIALAVAAVGGAALAAYAARLRARKGAAARGMLAPAFLVGPRGQRRALTTHEVLIGRGSGCHVVVPERTVSRRHARLRCAQGAWYLQNLAGAGRTLVNGRPVEAVRLRHGDRITIGSTTWTFEEAVR